MPDKFKKLFTPEFWEALWKLYLIGSLLTAFFYINKKWVKIWFISIVIWIKEGIEDADGQLNSKDLWLAVFSITLIIMGFLEWATQKPFSYAFWTIIGGLTGGGAISKGVEQYFINKKDNHK